MAVGKETITILFTLTNLYWLIFQIWTSHSLYCGYLGCSSLLHLIEIHFSAPLTLGKELWSFFFGLLLHVTNVQHGDECALNQNMISMKSITWFQKWSSICISHYITWLELQHKWISTPKCFTAFIFMSQILNVLVMPLKQWTGKVNKFIIHVILLTIFSSLHFDFLAIKWFRLLFNCGLHKT